MTEIYNCCETREKYRMNFLVSISAAQSTHLLGGLLLGGGLLLLRGGLLLGLLRLASSLCIRSDVKCKERNAVVRGEYRELNQDSKVGTTNCCQDGTDQ